MDFYATSETKRCRALGFERTRLAVGCQHRPSGSLRAPARHISLKGSRAESGRASPLRKKTSAAYGFSRHSIAEGVAGDCPVKKVAPSRTRHVPFRGIGCSLGKTSSPAIPASQRPSLPASQPPSLPASQPPSLFIPDML